MKSLSLVGRILFALIIIFFGLNHFMGAEGMTGMVPGFLPAKIFWVYLTGLALVAAGIAIIIGKQGKLAAALLGLMLILFALLIHLPGFIEQNPVASAMFLKDLALGAAAWYMSGHLTN